MGIIDKAEHAAEAAEHAVAKFAAHLPKHAIAVALVVVLRELAAETASDLDDEAVNVVAKALGVTPEDEAAHKPSA